MGKNKVNNEHIKRLKNGDMDTFQHIYSQYKNPLYYFIHIYVENEADCEEILQEVFIKVLRNIESLENINAFHSWLYTIAYHQAMRIYKKKSLIDVNVVKKETYDIDAFSHKEEGPSKAFNEQELKDIVKSTIEVMPEKFSSVAMLRYFEEFSVKEIAEILDIPEGTVKNRLSRIRATLQPLLEKKGVTPNKYLSVSVPLIVLSLNEIVAQSPITAAESFLIYQNIIMTLGANASGGLGFSSMGVKILSVGVIGLGSYGIYQEYQSMREYDSKNAIEQISYNDKITNGDVSVTVLINRDRKGDDIQIFEGDRVIPYSVKDERVVFSAKNNGKYEICVDNTRTSIEINNIDKELPVLHDVQYQDSGIVLNVSDNYKLSYEHSKVIMNNKEYSIDELGNVIGDFSEPFIVELVDLAGNTKKYSITVEKDT